MQVCRNILVTTIRYQTFKHVGFKEIVSSIFSFEGNLFCREIGLSFNVHRGFEIDATFDFGALAGEFQRVRAKILITSSHSRNTHEITHPSSTAKFSTARADTAYSTGFLAGTNLFHFDTHSELLGKDFNQLAEIHPIVGDIIEDSLTTITLKFDVTDFHIEFHIVSNLASANHGVVFTGFSFVVFLHINRFYFTVNSAYFITLHIDMIFLYLAEHESPHKCNDSDIVTGICFYSHHIAFFDRDMVTI